MERFGIEAALTWLAGLDIEKDDKYLYDEKDLLTGREISIFHEKPGYLLGLGKNHQRVWAEGAEIVRQTNVKSNPVLPASFALPLMMSLSAARMTAKRTMSYRHRGAHPAGQSATSLPASWSRRIPRPSHVILPENKRDRFMLLLQEGR